MAESELPDVPKPKGNYMEAAALLSHVQMLESKLPQDDEQHFGHPPPPQLHMCRIHRDGNDLGVVAMLAVTKRCVSAQLLKETAKGFSSGSAGAAGAPVEVLVVANSGAGEHITAATLFALELPELSAADTMIIEDRAKQGRHSGVISLMSGGIIPVAASPRVAIVVGTSDSRVISVEFSVKTKKMQLVRRNHMVGKEVSAYFEPLPRARLTEAQKEQQRYNPTSSSKQQPRRSSSWADASTISGETTGVLRRRKDGPIVTFEPHGQVASMFPCALNGETKKTHIWISFGDGTTIRMHHAGFFPSVIQKNTESNGEIPDQQQQLQLESVLGDELVRCQVRLPEMEDTQVTIIPLPKYHPSPLAPFPTWKRPEFNDGDEKLPGGVPEQQHEEAPEIYEAVLYCTGAMADTFPTLAFYTSEDQFAGRIQGDPVEEPMPSDDGGVVGNLVNGFWGLFGGGGGGGGNKMELKEPVKKDPTKGLRHHPWDPQVPFPSINYEPISLYAGYERHDSPRQITSVTVDPNGDLAATADTLGRVSLIDLSTKQVIRMWKGFRETSCYWLQVPQETNDRPWAKQIILYLVIHSRQRRVVEIWRTRHGPRVKSMQVGREAQLLACREVSEKGYISTVYLAHSNVPFSNMNQVEKISVTEEEVSVISNLRTRPSRRNDAAKLSQDAAVRLNHLQQLLGDTNVVCKSIDVYKALQNIKSVKDLATALDTLSVAPALEERMQVEGSAFQRLAVAQCQEKLDEAVRESGNEALTNPHVQLLAFKIAYYSQLVGAYDILHGFEVGEETENLEVAPKTGWALEATGWTKTYEKVTGESIDEDVQQPSNDTLKFYIFSNACVSPKRWLEAPTNEDGSYLIYLSDSSRTRKDVLQHIFKPLLGDVFAFNVVEQTFGSLGIKHDYQYLLKCFGEWFMLLPVKAGSKKTLFAVHSPISRWLQHIVGHQLDSKTGTGPEVPLEALLRFCRDSTALVQAFWLATVCRDAVAQAATQKEEKTYGKISSAEAVSEWDKLLRQLRVCLLVYLRLNRIQLGACPITIDSVEEEGNFSVFDWLAHDELAMSHNNSEIVSLENACKLSSHSFDPSTTAGDEAAKFKTLQNSCLSAAISEEERAEYLVDFDDDDRIGALLLHLSAYNIPDVLLAHRALLLASKWGKRPKDLETLKHSVVALKALKTEGEYKSIASAVRIEVWQTRIRPVYRALLMGFDDVQEITPEVVAPLFHDNAWVKSFGKIAYDILLLISEIKWEDGESPNEYDLRLPNETETWPPLKDDFLLRRMVEKSRPVDTSAFAAHRVLMCALLVSNNIQALSQCIPSFYDLFTPPALFNAVVPLSNSDENQHAFMQDAIVTFARDYSGRSLDTLDLGEIDVLAELWDFDLKNVKTLFLLSMYEFGKDRIVDELLTKSASYISVQHFCEDGVDIVCRRLNDLLHVQDRVDVRNVMGQLDAEMCEWIRHRAEQSEALVLGRLDVPVGNTHLFALRLLSLAANAEISKEERIKIHSLIVLNGTLVKAMEES